MKQALWYLIMQGSKLAEWFSNLLHLNIYVRVIGFGLAPAKKKNEFRALIMLFSLDTWSFVIENVLLLS